MLRKNGLHRVAASDKLYRKLVPEHWDGQSGFILPQAFIDNYLELSMFVGRIASPRDVLEFFGRFPAVKKACGSGSLRPSPETMCDKGYGIAEIPARIVFELGLKFQPRPNGDWIDEKGHVNIAKAGNYAMRFADVARALTRDEMLRS
jgi:hypothetical protein